MRLTAVRAALNPRNIAYVYTPSYKHQFASLALALGVGWSVGRYIDRQDKNRMSRFRDKSALFGKEKGQTMSRLGATRNIIGNSHNGKCPGGISRKIFPEKCSH